MEDVNGNYMTVTYTKDQGQIYLDQIDYTGHTGGLSPTYYVKFYLEDRPDTPIVYVGNVRVVTAKRLKSIEVVAQRIVSGVEGYGHILGRIYKQISSIFYYRLPCSGGPGRFNSQLRHSSGHGGHGTNTDHRGCGLHAPGHFGGLPQERQRLEGGEKIGMSPNVGLQFAALPADLPANELGLSRTDAEIGSPVREAPISPHDFISSILIRVTTLYITCSSTNR